MGRIGKKIAKKKAQIDPATMPAGLQTIWANQERKKAEKAAAHAAMATAPDKKKPKTDAERAEKERRDEYERQLAHVLQLKRLLKIKKARDSLRDFIELCMPDVEDPQNTDKSRFKCEAHHKLLIEAIERIANGGKAGELALGDPDAMNRALMRFGVSIPPQHGKSLILSRYASAWIIGRQPWKHIIVATYASALSTKIGSDVREIMRLPQFAAVFPGCQLKADTQSKTVLATMDGGDLTFVGRGEATTGMPCDLFIIDDPYKNEMEAGSAVIREQTWEWYSSVVFTRCHVMTPIIIVHTRWNEDDLLGRLCDPSHPEYDAKRSRRWTYINVPAILDDERVAKLLGRQKGEALWPDRFPLQHLAEARENNARTFSALYMGRPSPEEGDYFKKDMLRGYDSPDELPKQLRMYGASDHAVSTKQERDATVAGCFGVDDADNIWIMPDVFWDRVETDKTVEEMLERIRRHKPIVWWAARDHISKSIGPFLRRRMQEEKVYGYIEESPETKDPLIRARSIQARMAMGKVFFPTFVSWWPRAKEEILKFPNATHDDFVSFLTHVGMGLDKAAKARGPKAANDTGPKSGTLAWVKAETKRDEREKRIIRLVGGM